MRLELLSAPLEQHHDDFAHLLNKISIAFSSVFAGFTRLASRAISPRPHKSQGLF